MNTETQAEALRLAARLDPAHSCKTPLLDLHREAAAELRRLHIVEQEFEQWINKTEWVQKSAQSHELGMHRADVMKQRLDQLLTENQQLRADLEAIGAGGVGPLMPAASSDHTEQHLGMVPARWKLVPVDLTKAMQAAGEAAWSESYFQYKNGILHMYRAMLAAAPQPPNTSRSRK